MKPRSPLLAVSTALLASAPLLAEQRRIDLPAGALGASIVELSRQSGASIRFADPDLWQQPAPAVRGTLSVQQALKRLLAGSGARPMTIGGSSWEIARRRLSPSQPKIVHDDPVVPETAIIVSASKRDVRLSDYAGSVSVLGGIVLGSEGPADSDAIADRAANVTSTHLGAGRDKLFIRGVADSGLVGQSQATVGQYLGDVRLSYNAPDPDLKLYDVARVEVLEGPQGTLYGAGSPGGIVRIVRNEAVPGRFEAAATAGLSTVAHGAAGGDGSLMLNLPIDDDTVALRMVGYADTDGGYIDNLTTGRKNINRTRTAGGRAVLRIDPGDGWTIRIGGTGQAIHGDDSQYADRDGPPLTRRSDIPQPYDDTYLMGEINVTKDWDGLRFTSSTDGVRQHIDERFDATLEEGEPRQFRQWNRTSLFSTENRLSRPMRNGVGWVIGTSYLHNDSHVTRSLGPVDGQTPTVGVLNRIEELTAFGELSVEPVHGLILTVGARVAHSRLSGHALGAQPGLAPLEPVAAIDNFPIVTQPYGPARLVQTEADIRLNEAARSETKLLPSLSASVEPAAGVILFTRYEQGFRPGGLAVGNYMIRRFKSDRVETAELGVRYDRPGNDTISLAASVAYTRWKNIQADFIDGDGLPVTTNIGDGRIWSFDARAAWQPLRGLRLEGSIVVNDSKVTRPDVTQLQSFRLLATNPDGGSELPNVAELGGRIGATYQARIGGYDINAGTWARYIGKSRLGVGPLLGGKEGDYVDTAFSVRVGRGRYGVTLSATNLLDTVGNRFALGTPLDVVRNTEITPLQPRTVRIGFDAHF